MHYYYMKKEYLEQLKKEYIRKKMFASGFDERENQELGTLRSKILTIEASLQT